MTQKLLRDSGVNLLGSAIPIILTILAFPFLIKVLGMERFGWLSLSWAIIGYLSLLDFGLGRALSQQTATNHDKQHHVMQIFWDTHTLIACIGVLGTLLTAISVNWYFSGTHNHALELKQVLWATVLMILPSLGINSMSYFLIAIEEFVLLNILKTSLSSLNIIAPALICSYASETNIFEYIMLSLLGARWLFLFIFFLACLHTAPYLKQMKSWQFRYPTKLIKLGGWITITNIVGPIMTYFDRFFIAAILSPSAVGGYSIAYELASKLNIIAAALSTPLAPFFAKQNQQQSSVAQTFIFTIIIISSLFIPLLVCIHTYGDLLLHWWLKHSDVTIIHQLTQWLALGFFFNAIALVFYTHIQFIERPDITAKIHLIELPIYLAILITLLIDQGIIGAAIAWVIRATVDMLLLMTYSLKIDKALKKCVISA